MSSTAESAAIDIAALFAAHHARLERYYDRRLRDPQLAEDLTAETYLRAHGSRERFTGADGDAVRWLYGIAHHVLADHWRRSEASDAALRRVPVELDIDVDEDPEDVLRVLARAQLRDLVEPALRRLPADQRAALDLRVVDELPYGEVASRLNVNTQLARARVSRGLAALAATFVAAGLDTLI
jgi:RNA polymerase sigma-70 factor (ECF subfamily)